jgi:4-amino-4-deoxy-L-arabinose transferase-like glycosyltransferase
VFSAAEKIAKQTLDRAPAQSTDRWLLCLFGAAVVFVLLYQLGGAALFEPDEGRNSEKAREILVLNDWVTPHENFHPVLDKPIFFYWLIALSFRLFGVSAWAARLPSALAALGCVLLVYRFARTRWGRWEALWAALILLTSTEFFILARVVIFDMTLTFLQTIALWAFYEVDHAEETSRRRIFCVIMYLALGAGTLIKGLIGVVIPGIVFLFYILLLRRWQILRKIYLIPGALLFFAVVLPWYLQADARNPGYLSYYIWSEHFGRYATATFDRWEPWYYFIVVGLVGFFPWTLLLPLVVKDHWKRAGDDKTLFLILWAVLPFLFFSASKSKLPHYILPIFPALSILTAAALVRLHQTSGSTLRFALALGWLVQSLNALYLATGSLVPSILPHQIRESLGGMAHFVWIYAVVSVVLLGYMARHTPTRDDLPRQRQLYMIHGVGLGFFVIFIARMMIAIAPGRSAQTIVEKALPQITPPTQVVFYDAYLAGMAFYLRAEQPIWLITHGKKRTFLGNYYAIGRREDPVTPWGKAIFDFAEFRQRWKMTKQPLLIILKEKNLERLAEDVGEAPKKLATSDEYVLVTKQ